MKPADAKAGIVMHQSNTIRSLYGALPKPPCGPSEAWAGAGGKNYNSQEASGGPALGGDAMGAGAGR